MIFTMVFHKRISLALSVVFWVAVWQLISMLVPSSLLLASPAQVLSSLWELLACDDFYSSLGLTFRRITMGFFFGALTGVLLAIAACKLNFVEILLRPFMGVIKAAPVASFVVLALLMVGSDYLSSLISFLMVMPVFYANLMAGIKSVEPERFEAAAVFGMLPRDRFRFIYLPYVTPFFASSCEVGWGNAWKAGVSAEVIGIAAGSVGEKLYDAKLTLETAELMAYTLTVVLVSLALERVTVLAVSLIEKILTR